MSVGHDQIRCGGEWDQWWGGQNAAASAHTEDGNGAVLQLEELQSTVHGNRRTR